jgi:hypothetical protein
MLSSTMFTSSRSCPRRRVRHAAKTASRLEAEGEARRRAEEAVVEDGVAHAPSSICVHARLEAHS